MTSPCDGAPETKHLTKPRLYYHLLKPSPQQKAVFHHDRCRGALASKSYKMENAIRVHLVQTIPQHRSLSHDPQCDDRGSGNAVTERCWPH